VAEVAIGKGEHYAQILRKNIFLASEEIGYLLIGLFMAKHSK
jgi:hypothetical protein